MCGSRIIISIEKSKMSQARGVLGCRSQQSLVCYLSLLFGEKFEVFH